MMHRCRGNTKNDKGIPLAMLPRQRVEASLASLQRLLWHRWLWWCESKSNPPSQHYSGPQIDRNDVQYILNVGIYLSIYLRVKITFLHGNPLLVHEQHSLVPRRMPTARGKKPPENSTVRVERAGPSQPCCGRALRNVQNWLSGVASHIEAPQSKRPLNASKESHIRAGCKMPLFVLLYCLKNSR